MSKFETMTLDQVKAYFLEHRDDNEAFHAYMDKLHESGRAIVIEPNDPEWEAKAIAAIQQKLSHHPQTD